MWSQFINLIKSNSGIQAKLSGYNLMLSSSIPEWTETEKKQLKKAVAELLGVASTRYEGLMLWQLLIQKKEFYTEQWPKMIIRSIDLADTSTRKLCLHILDLLVEKFHCRTDFVTFIEKSMRSLLKTFKAVETEVELQCVYKSIHILLVFLPAVLTPHREDVVSLFIRCLNSNNQQIVMEMAACLALLPRSYPRQNSHTTKEAAWENLLNQVVATIRQQTKEIDSYFSGSPVPASQEPVFDLPCEEVGMSLLLHRTQVIFSLSLSLAKLISSETPVGAGNQRKLLELVKEQIEFDTSRDEAIGGHINPKLRFAALVILEAIVKKFPRGEHVKHTVQLLQIALQISPSSGRLRYSIWQFMIRWMQHSGCTVSSQIVIALNFVDELVFDILRNIQESYSEYTTLLMCSKSALKVLALLLQLSTPFFEREQLKSVAEQIIELARRVHSEMHGASSPSQYMDQSCRLELYNLLYEMCMNKHPLQSEYILECTYYLKMGLKDPSTEIRNICQKVCNSFDVILNAEKPVPEYQSTAPELQQQIPFMNSHDHLVSNQTLSNMYGPPPMYPIGMDSDEPTRHNSPGYEETGRASHSYDSEVDSNLSSDDVRPATLYSKSDDEIVPIGLAERNNIYPPAPRSTRPNIQPIIVASKGNNSEDDPSMHEIGELGEVEDDDEISYPNIPGNIDESSEDDEEENESYERDEEDIEEEHLEDGFVGNQDTEDKREPKREASPEPEESASESEKRPTVEEEEELPAKRIKAYHLSVVPEYNDVDEISGLEEPSDPDVNGTSHEEEMEVPIEDDVKTLLSGMCVVERK